MAIIKRYYYADTINLFLQKSNEEILGELERGSREFSSLYGAQGRAWDREIEEMRQILPKYKGRGTIIFEYTIPRLGKRIDIVLLIDGIIFVLEYKAFSGKYENSDIEQAFDYALDLKHFHAESKDRYIVPILIATDADSRTNELKEYRENIFLPLLCNTANLDSTIQYCIENIPRKKTSSDSDWTNGRYEPTPSIIEAVTHMYHNHTVDDITKKGSEEEDFAKTCQSVEDIITKSESNNRKSICFVTGVPGAGKTLVGMNIATKYLAKSGRAVYLSGNGPLVDVLCESLASDLVKRSKEIYKHKCTDIDETEGITNEEKRAKKKALPKPINKNVALATVRPAIQKIHLYRKACLENTKEENGRIVEAVVNNDATTSNFIPVDHVAIFDEAQRAWSKPGLAKWMNEKQNWPNFPLSEPDFLISCIDRHEKWGVVVCLVGGGQEINHNESGIEEWINSINWHYPDWDVYISNKLKDSEYMAGEALACLQKSHKNVFVYPELHLSVSRRSFKAERLAAFVKAVLDCNVADAQKELSELKEYPILLTRDLEKAKQQLREWSFGSSERVGLLASSKAVRLKPLGINMKAESNVIPYFLSGKDDIRSSQFLEDAVSEFDVQGLELDWTCLIWDADFRYQDFGWSQHDFKGSRWLNIGSVEDKNYQKNAYRVLLTRARQGLIICIPEGNLDDPTRLPEFYDSTYNYLKSLGLTEL